MVINTKEYLKSLEDYLGLAKGVKLKIKLQSTSAHTNIKLSSENISLEILQWDSYYGSTKYQFSKNVEGVITLISGISERDALRNAFEEHMSGYVKYLFDDNIFIGQERGDLKPNLFIGTGVVFVKLGFAFGESPNRHHKILFQSFFI